MVDVQDTLLDPPMVNCISCCNSLQLIGQQYGQPSPCRNPHYTLRKDDLEDYFHQINHRINLAGSISSMYLPIKIQQSCKTIEQAFTLLAAMSTG
jgi:hypothetical protein